MLKVAVSDEDLLNYGYRVTDNFMPEHKFRVLQEHILSHHFSWFYNDGQAYLTSAPKLFDFQFTHNFYSPNAGKSTEFFALNDFLIALAPAEVLRIKANLGTATPESLSEYWHTDYKTTGSPHITAVLYLNTNNGATLFRDGTRVESVENRLVEFDSRLEHTGCSQTDVNRRCVLNINYRK